MHRPPIQRFASSRRLSWVLWLALLLPLAQVSASWHAMSHLQLDTADADGKQTLHQSHCDLCITAAAVHGGALPGEPPRLVLGAVRHVVPQAVVASVWTAPAARPYQSRAPPIALS
jgi:hypothetical protein